MNQVNVTYYSKQRDEIKREWRGVMETMTSFACTASVITVTIISSSAGRLQTPIALPPSDNCVIRLSILKCWNCCSVYRYRHQSLHKLWRQWLSHWSVVRVEWKTNRHVRSTKTGKLSSTRTNVVCFPTTPCRRKRTWTHTVVLMLYT